MRVLIITLITTIVLFACSKQEESTFFENCSCEKVDFSSGIIIQDSLKHYSVKIPSSAWRPTMFVDKFHNGVTAFNTENKKFEAVNITETIKGEDFISPEEEMKSPTFNQIVEKGELYFQGKSRNWYVLKHDEDPTPLYSLYLFIDRQNLIYTINISVEQEARFKSKICRLEKFLDQININ